MANEYDLEAVIRFTAEGQQKVAQNVDGLQRQLDSLRKTGKITEDQFQQFAKSLTVAGNAAQQKLGRQAAGAAVNLQDLDSGLKNVNTSLNSQRYALYDLASTYGIVSAALLGMNTVAIKTAADFESAFTGVERTLDPTYNAVGDLRKELVDLSTQIPLTFQDISQIAQLGNQLGIAGDKVAGFTETVAQFSAVSGIGVEETAQAFGVLQNLLGISADEYDNLGSAIALVGVNSAATEAQIISVAREISAYTSQAGFGADGTIALAGALASLRVPPEQARSAIQQFSTTLRKAVAGGGGDLQNFATVTGMTVDELDRLVRSGEDGDKIFRAFLGTLASGDPVQTTQALDALGLSNLRVDNAVQKLTGSLDVYDRAISDSAAGYAESTELARQYAFVVDDLNSRWMMFVNSLNALVATLSGGAASGLADLLAIVTDVVNGFRDFAEQNQWVVNLAAATIALTTIVGVLTAFRTAQLLATASTYAFITAQSSLQAQSGITGITGLIAAMFGYTTATAGATLATKAFRVALISTGVGALIVLLGYLIALMTDTEATVRSTADAMGGLFDIASAVFGALQGVAKWFGDVAQGAANAIPWLQGLADTWRNIANALGYLSQASGNPSIGLNALFPPKTEKRAVNLNAILGDNYEATLKSLTASNDFSGSLDKVGESAGGTAKQIRTLVDYANDLAGVFSRSFDIRFKSTLAMDTVAESWQTLTDRIESARIELQKLTADKTIKEYFLSIANQYGDTLRAGELGAELADINQKIAETQAEATSELNGNTKGARNNRKALTDILKQYDDYISALAEGGADQATLNNAVNQSRAQFIAQAQALGYSNAELQPYIASFNDLSTALARIPRNVTVTPNLDPALQALNEFVAKASTAGASAGAGFASGMQQGLAKTARGIELQNEIAQMQATLGQYIASGNISGARYMGQAIAEYSRRLASGNYAQGGYTGPGGKYEVAGIVHKGEYVVPKEQVNQRTGLPYASALGQLQRGTRGSSGYASGGFVSGDSMVVDLSAGSLRAMNRPIQLVVDGKVLASVVYGNNVQQSLRGSN